MQLRSVLQGSRITARADRAHGTAVCRRIRSLELAGHRLWLDFVGFGPGATFKAGMSGSQYRSVVGTGPKRSRGPARYKRPHTRLCTGLFHGYRKRKDPAAHSRQVYLLTRSSMIRRQLLHGSKP